MKHFFTLGTIIILVTTSLIVHAQSPTIRQIFDFEINDEFHYNVTHYGNVPPEGTRNKIIGKYYSTNLDTLFYIRQNNDYRTTFNPSPTPHLNYIFNNFIDTIAYTNLDSSIQYFILQQFYQTNYTTTFFTDTTPSYCQDSIIGANSMTGSFEPNIISQSYSKKLGIVDYRFYASSYIPIVDDEAMLVYYKKSYISCGTPDTVGLSIRKIDNIMKLTIYPNPTSQNLNISLLANNQYIKEIRIYNLQFKGILNRPINAKQSTIDVSKFAKGVYIIEGKTDTGESFWKKFVVE